MSHIIAAHFQQQEQVEHVINQLMNAGFTEDNICSFYLNPAGQHDLYSIGGDRDKSPGAKQSGETMTRGGATGSVIGGAAGAAGIPVAGPIAPAVGALLGAHIGSLIGTLSGMKEADEADDGENHTAALRKSGMMVAVSADAKPEDAAIDIFQSMGADQIERAEGTISGGNWEDFDPLSEPELVKKKD
jgi:hypothetical protein